jgi:hypothetical protein
MNASLERLVTPQRSEAFKYLEHLVLLLQAQRLDRDKIVAHYQEAGPRNTFLAFTCEKQLRTGEVAKLCYVMGKHQLSYAKDKPRDMQACMQLALAETSADIQDACRSPKTGAYCLHRRAYLRQAFVTFYVTSQRHVLDTHKDYLTRAGWTEHTLFISALIQDKAFLSPVCQGPSNSRPKKSPKKKKNVQKSERTKAMLAAPELVAGNIAVFAKQLQIGQGLIHDRRVGRPWQWNLGCQGMQNHFKLEPCFFE